MRNLITILLLAFVFCSYGQDTYTERYAVDAELFPHKEELQFQSLQSIAPYTKDRFIESGEEFYLYLGGTWFGVRNGNYKDSYLQKIDDELPLIYKNTMDGIVELEANTVDEGAYFNTEPIDEIMRDPFDEQFLPAGFVLIPFETYELVEKAFTKYDEGIFTREQYVGTVKEILESQK